MLIPEVILHNIISNFLNIIREDFTTHSSQSVEKCTMLYMLFKKDDNGNDITYSGGKYNFYTQAKAILLKTNEKQRKLEHFIGYNLERQGAPSIHILLPTENKGRFDSIGLSEGNLKQRTDCTGNHALFNSKSTTHTSVFHLMITSDNSHEVIIIYYFLKAMFTIYSEYVGLSGLLNLNFSGQDITMQQDLAPSNIFHRNLTLQFDYESNIDFRSNSLSTQGGIRFKMCQDVYLDVVGNGLIAPSA